MKFKPGDKVRVKDDPGDPVVGAMHQFEGQIVTIADYIPSCHVYYIEEDGRNFLWVKHNFEPIERYMPKTDSLMAFL